jgi:hypothetical protein
MQRYTPPKPAPLPDDFQEFYASLTSEEKELHELAIEKLQSSYFIQWTHMYHKWSQMQKKLDAVEMKSDAVEKKSDTVEKKSDDG